MKNLLIFLSLISYSFSTTHIRQYSWDYQYGNLLTNWSFENEYEEWEEIKSSEVDVRHDPSGFSAKHGRFVAKCSVVAASGIRTLGDSKFIRILPSTAYTLSFYYRGSGITSSTTDIALHTSTSSSASSIPQITLSTQNDWTLANVNFTTGSNENYAQVFLYATINGGGTVYYDDIILEEGTWNLTEIADRRKKVIQSISYTDGFGLSHQSQSMINDTLYLTSGAKFDEQGRVEKSYLPHTNSLGYVTALESSTQSFYDGNPAPDANGFPWAEAEYAIEPGGRAVKTGSQGNSWKIGSGNEITNGFYYLNSLDSLPLNIETGDSNLTNRIYRLDWVKNVEDNYSLTWTDPRGNLAQVARNINTAPTNNMSDWSRSRYEYYPNGALKKVLTPLDISGSSEDFKEISNYDSRGLLTSSYSKNRGLVKYFYNGSGNLRYSQDEIQRGRNEYIYQDYNFNGNLVSAGIQIIDTLTRGIIELDSFGFVGVGGKVEQIGYVYHDTSKFESTTGYPFNEVMPGVSLGFYHNRLVCEYSTNADSKIKVSSNKEKLVVNCFDYDNTGRTVNQYKYIGAVQDSNKRVQKISYEYDDSDFLTKMRIFSSPSDVTPITEQIYFYDDLGRVEQITGLNDNIAKYVYNDWGTLKSVHLGGGTTLQTGILITYDYHIQGWVKEIKATKVGTSNILYHQFLGYEDKAFSDSSVPALTEARLTGQITQNLYKLAGQEGPTRVLNLDYDELGRMLQANYQRSLVLEPLNTNNPIASPVDALVDVDDYDSDLSYDINGRITKKRTAGIDSENGATYNYVSGSYQLDKITGSISPDTNRDLSASGTFGYDARGALVEDKSQNLKLEYGWDIMPLNIIAKSSEDTTAVFVKNLYGPDGQRTTRVTLLGPAPKIDEIIVGIQGFGEPDIFDVATLDLALAELQSRLDIMSVGEVPSRFLIYQVVDTSETLIEPTSDSIVQLVKDDTITVDLEIEGIIRGTSDYDSLIAHKEAKRTASTQYFDDEKELHEVYIAGGTYLHTVSIAGLFGRGAKIGRVLSNGDYEFYVKNHIGSTVRLADEDGNTSSKDVYDYLSYGEHNYVSDNADEVEVTEKFTGKELEKNLQAYYFGARFYDPLLGIWMAPDPANQFFNPYSYGGDPINGTDPDGQCFEVISGTLCAIAAGAIIGGYMKGSAANSSYNPLDWNISNTWDDVLMGAAIGGASTAAGIYSGGLGAGFWGTVGSGALSGSAAGATGGGLSYLSRGLYGQSMTGRGFLSALGQGATQGAIGGALGGAFSFGAQEFLSRGVDFGYNASASFEVGASMVGAGGSNIGFQLYNNGGNWGQVDYYGAGISAAAAGLGTISKIRKYGAIKNVQSYRDQLSKEQITELNTLIRKALADENPEISRSRYLESRIKNLDVGKDRIIMRTGGTMIAKTGATAMVDNFMDPGGIFSQRGLSANAQLNVFVHEAVHYFGVGGEYGRLGAYGIQKQIMGKKYYGYY